MNHGTAPEPIWGIYCIAKKNSYYYGNLYNCSMTMELSFSKSSHFNNHILCFREHKIGQTVRLGVIIDEKFTF